MDKPAKEYLIREARKYAIRIQDINSKHYTAQTVYELINFILALTPPECDFDKYGETVTHCDPWEPPSDCNVCPPTPKKFIVIAITKRVRDPKDVIDLGYNLVKCWDIIGQDYAFKKAENIAKCYISDGGGLQCIIQEHVVYG